MKKIKTLITSTFFFLPTITFAQAQISEITSVKGLANLALDVVGYLMQTLFALISLYIIYTIFKYINAIREGDKDADRYRKILIWAIVGLAVAFSLWGIIGLITSTLGWGEAGIPVLSAPTVN